MPSAEVRMTTGQRHPAPQPLRFGSRRRSHKSSPRFGSAARNFQKLQLFYKTRATPSGGGPPPPVRFSRERQSPTLLDLVTDLIRWERGTLDCSLKRNVHTGLFFSGSGCSRNATNLPKSGATTNRKESFRFESEWGEMVNI